MATSSTRSSRRTTRARSRRSCRWPPPARRDSKCSACTAWARASIASWRARRRRWPRCRCASTRRWASIAICWPTSCGACSRTAPTPRSCISCPTPPSTSTPCSHRLSMPRRCRSSLPLPVDLYRRGRRGPRPEACARTHAASTSPISPSASRSSRPSRRRVSRPSSRPRRSASPWPWPRRRPHSRHGTRHRSASALRCCAGRPTHLSRASRNSAACWSSRPARHRATASPRSAKRSTSAATTPTRRSAGWSRRRCPGRPAKATSCTCTAEACSRASARGISRSRSSAARWRPRSSPATAVVAKPAEQTPAVAARMVALAARRRRAASTRSRSCTARARRSAPRSLPTRESAASASPARCRWRRRSTACSRRAPARSCR